MKRGIWSGCFLLFGGFLAVGGSVGAGCSSEASRSVPDAVVGCDADEQCPGGSCVSGKCVTFGSQDSLAEAVGPGEVQDVLPEDSKTEGWAPPGDIIAEQSGSDDTPTQDKSGPNPGKETGDPDISVEPLSYMFTFLPGVDNPQTKNVTIYNEGKGVLSITAIEWKQGSSPEYKFMALPPLPKKLNPSEQTALTVVFKEKPPHGPAFLQIFSNDPDEPVVTVEFTSQSKSEDQPCIGVQPSSLNFGQVVRGHTKTLDFNLVNCSTKFAINVTKIERSKFFGIPLTDEFQLVPMPQLPLVLAGNQSVPMSVSYTPGLAGVDSGYFTFKTDNAYAPEAKLDVAGVGVPPPLEEIGLHIELEWDADNSDVDLHLIRPGGKLFDCESDCYYANPNPDWGTKGDYLDDPFLDYDDVDGFGPENTNLSQPIAGTYKVVMHYYNDSYEGWTGGPTGVTVRVYTYGMLVEEFGPTILTATDKTWDVCTIDWPGAVVTPLGQIYEAPDQPICLPW